MTRLTGRVVRTTEDTKDLTIYVNDLTEVLNAAIDRINEQAEEIRLLHVRIDSITTKHYAAIDELEAKYEGHVHYFDHVNNERQAETTLPKEPTK